MIVSIIAAIAEGNRAIGLRGGLPWHLPADLARFRQLTMGHWVIMGRVTWEALAEQGLPGRRMIILSRLSVSDEFGAEVQHAASLDRALEIATESPDTSEVFIAGGSAVFQAALAADVVDRMYLTLVEAEVEGDAFFPEYDLKSWTTRSIEKHPSDENNPYAMVFHTLERSSGR